MLKRSPNLSMLSPLILILYFNLGCGFLKIMANGQKTWCIANPSASNGELIANLDYACSRLDCSQIQEGGRCFYPNTFIHHASFAMNLYYQSNGRNLMDCDFKNSGLVSATDPSYGSCTYHSGGDVAENGTSETWCVANPTISNGMLQDNIDFACNHVDCSPIQDGGSCFHPTTPISHATFAMNLYYQSTGRTPSSCDFQGTGLIVSKNPSYGNCTHIYRRGTNSSSGKNPGHY